jgi:hypothetical protein
MEDERRARELYSEQFGGGPLPPLRGPGGWGGLLGISAIMQRLGHFRQRLINGNNNNDAIPPIRPVPPLPPFTIHQHTHHHYPPGHPVLQRLTPAPAARGVHGPREVIDLVDDDDNNVMAAVPAASSSFAQQPIDLTAINPYIPLPYESAHRDWDPSDDSSSEEGLLPFLYRTSPQAPYRLAPQPVPYVPTPAPAQPRGESIVIDLTCDNEESNVPAAAPAGATPANPLPVDASPSPLYVQ